MKLSTSTKIAILNGSLLLLLTLSEFFGLIKFNLVLSYNWHKLLHIFGSIIFMGNMIVGPFWFLYAFYSKDKSLLKFANRLLQITDMYLTIPGAFLTVINGLFLASAFGGTKNQPWLFYSIISMIAMWVLSIPLIYLQEKMCKLIETDPENEIKLNKILSYWGILGTIVMIPPTYVFYLMVVKTI